MPAKRRQKSKARSRLLQDKDASSEDMDSETSEDKRLTAVMSRLSKKHLLNSSSEESSCQKENLAKKLLGDPYDADQETSEADATSQSDMECSASLSRGVLSPSRSSNCQDDSEKEILPKAAKNKSQRTKSGNNRKNRSPSPSQCEDTPTDNKNPHSRKTTPPMNQLFSPNPELQARFPLLNASDTSTPHSMMSDKKSDFNDSCFGFETLLSPPALPFSPVPLVASDGRGRLSNESTSGISSMQSSQLSMSTSEIKQYGQKKRPINVNFTGLVQSEDESKKKVKRKRIGPKKKNPHVDEWASKIGAEFDDIEMFELSVE